jgi:hypothetical protein
LDADGDLLPCEELPGRPAAAVIPPDLFGFGRGELRSMAVLHRQGVPATGVQAVVLNVTSTKASGSGYVQVIPHGGPTPPGASSNLNVVAGQTIANLVVVPVGAQGLVDVFNHAGGHVVVDVFGYFTDVSAAASASGLFVPVKPARLLDTRGKPRPAPGAQTAVQPLGKGAIPGANVAAVFLNVTATETGGTGFGQVMPYGQASPGAFSNLNIERIGQTIPNASVSPLGTGGELRVYVVPSSHLVVDTAGYFTS